MTDRTLNMLSAERHLLGAILNIIDVIRIDEGCALNYEIASDEQTLAYNCLSAFLEMPIPDIDDSFSDYLQKRKEAYSKAEALLPPNYMKYLQIEMESQSIRELRSLALEIRDTLNRMLSND